MLLCVSTPDLTSQLDPTAELRAVRGRGRSQDGRVELELDGAGALVDVAISSTAMDGNRGSLERCFREAHDAARANLEVAVADVAGDFGRRMAERQGALVAEAQALATRAEADIDRVVAALESRAARTEASW